MGSGLYYSFHGMHQAFYQLSPVSAMLPALFTARIIHRGDTSQKMQDFLEGARHSDIVTMCFVFLLSGAFSHVTKNIGSIEAIVNCILTYLPGHWALVSLFLVAVVVSTSIGISKGTIATIAPVAYTLCQKLYLDAGLGMGTLVGGAMFGDSFSPISDTMIASVSSQNANPAKKLRLNAGIASAAGGITLLCVYLMQPSVSVSLAVQPYDIWLVTPYIVLLRFAFSGVNVFLSHYGVD